jgi:hypothetical protein
MEDVSIFYGHLVYLRPFDIFYGYSVYFVVILYICPHVGILYKEKSGNPGKVCWKNPLLWFESFFHKTFSNKKT